MGLSLENLSKNYQGQVIIPTWNAEFGAEDRVAILGGNGSGKSTLLKLLSGQISPSTGRMSCPEIPEDKWTQSISYTGPHVDLLDAFSPRELFEQHERLRPLRFEANLQNLPIAREAMERPLSRLSSGMKQRVKLALAIWTDAPLLLLDEPCSHLDLSGIKWFQELLAHSLTPSQNYTHRMLWIASNHKKEEISHCQLSIHPSGEAVVPL
ncbi:MAG: ATP-binding cassette domain-containing protein [Schleiferiaceae bacterium]|nr:ATP-binding cassette domain-containing protein [Schleiferiaceae bacterium]